LIITYTNSLVQGRGEEKKVGSARKIFSKVEDVFLKFLNVR
jgi:hypothetical protein